ncbi:unnamed protein product [Echinostoma caproni]|uniref:Na_H_Exchanger domain-containing protein n=1 Tax=Echinostoma caproni TaxID=27848 RepID=A0A183ADS1_9TREM|nr:unnamed protein product [Echinostoma caproni]
MLLGGLALRNIGSLFIPEKIYHQSTIPNGSYPIDTNNSWIPDDKALFSVNDPWTQMSALLLVNPSLSGVLRQLALTTILSRAGLGLDPTTLKQVCGSVFRLAIIPCVTEAAALMLVTRFLIGWPWTWGAILGFACAAVSPAVIVPNMMRLEVAGWGVAEGIPTLVVAASSLDDVLAITGFGVALAVALSTGENLAATLFWGPAEALCGAAFGASVGSLLCLFPPPKLEHSHLIRGILLICLAVTGLVGSVGLHLPGAGALACLTLAFIVAMGWRAGLPWRFTQPSEPYLGHASGDLSSNTDPAGSEDGLTKPPPNTRLQVTYSPGSNVTEQNKPDKLDSGTANILEISSKSEPIRETGGSVRLTDAMSSQRSGRHKDSTSSNILENLIEYHPYYCSILKQQYSAHPSRHSASQTTSNRGSGKSSIRQLTGGDLPAIAVAVAATAGSGTGRKDSGYVTSGQGAQLRSRSRTSRRFSLPEPTAHYEMESFSTTGSFQRGISPPSDRSSGRQGTQRSRRRILSPTFREQYAAVCNQPVDKLEELVECEDEIGAATQPMKLYKLGEQNSNADADQQEQSGLPNPNEDSPLSATPQERGLACLNSMRQTLAAVWWFVQPILFSLIGAEVDLSNLAGASTAAMAIILTAPLGAILMPVTAPYLLHQDLNASEVMVARTRQSTKQPESNANKNTENLNSHEATTEIVPVPNISFDKMDGNSVNPIPQTNSNVVDGNEKCA